ncbi:Tfp pilus assembly protein, ATPase PilM [Thermaerobacter subterraneus DSM 13965]|uniref:Tfp pilus assembly protein, ATPase PilM n=1 Tax=Thermaerobacter subterraneus DSM 13965 TaxID=867903 RepID=K6PZW4_9FIRM|nr:Tfp pilus assembly protein, ATPase PilM [Thermaerobacter subterraneus DSM 13965]
MTRLDVGRSAGLGVDLGSTGVRWARWSPEDGVQGVSPGSKGRVTANLPGDEAILRIMPAPPVPRRELPLALKWELQRILPFSVEDAVFDYVILPGRGGGTGAAGGSGGPLGRAGRLDVAEGRDDQVVVAGAPVAVIDARYRQLARRGIRPMALEPEWVTLWRITRFLQLLADPGRSCAVIDLGHTSTRLLVIGPDGAPVAFHRSAAGSGALETELAAQLGVSVTQLRQLRATELRHDVAALVRTATATELIGDVTRLFRRARQETGSTPADVWAIGGGAAWPALVAALSDTAGTVVMVPGTEGVERLVSRFDVDPRSDARWASQTAVTLARCDAPSVLAAGLALWHAVRWAASRGQAWPASSGAASEDFADPDLVTVGMQEVRP